MMFNAQLSINNVQFKKGASMVERTFDLEDRFADYTCRMTDVVELRRGAGSRVEERLHSQNGNRPERAGGVTEWTEDHSKETDAQARWRT